MLNQQSQSFEEFHTSQRRQRAVQKASEEIVSKRTPSEVDNNLDNVVSSKVHERPNEKDWKPISTYITSNVQKAGIFVEKVEVQIIVLSFIWFDLILSAIDLLLQNNQFSIENLAFPVKIVNQILVSLANFNLVIFLVELHLLILVFGVKKFAMHPGYMIDYIIISVNAYSEFLMSNFHKKDECFLRLLGLLRVWRIVRVFSSSLDLIRQETKLSNVALSEEKQKTTVLENELQNMKTKLELEVAAKVRVEKMLQGYKDEAETLTEALEIAAYDITVAMANSDENKAFIDEVGDKFYDGKNTSVPDPNSYDLTNINTSKKTKIVVKNDRTFELE